MTVGEVDFNNVFIDTIGKNNTSTGNPLNPFPEASFIFVGFFLLFMSIILMNLLVSSKARFSSYVCRRANLSILINGLKRIAHA